MADTHRVPLPIPDRYSAAVECSFAYVTVKDRLPRILVQIIDTLHKQKERILKDHDQPGLKDLKHVIGELSKLRYQMMTNKPIDFLKDDLPDRPAWDQYMQHLLDKSGSSTLKWYTESWLFVECYMYRYVISMLSLSKYLLHFDPFFEMKKKSFADSQPAIQSVVEHLSGTLSSTPSTEAGAKEILYQFCELSLWGNRCDLSISGGEDNAQKSNPLHQLGQLDQFLLANDFDDAWDYLLSLRKKAETTGSRVDIIMDNAGFEFVSDLCLAEVLLALGIASRIIFHVKKYPWFVSDTTLQDIQWCIQEFASSERLVKQSAARNWVNRSLNHVFEIKEDEYWTQPHDFAAMRYTNPHLYSELAKSDLLIFKGDLNYRKLTGDRDWEIETSFDKSLGEFHPAPLLALRTLKGGPVVGLSVNTNRLEKTWRTSGQYGLIQFTSRTLPLQLPIRFADQ